MNENEEAKRRLAEVRYRCCDHCGEDPVHDVEFDGHELPCSVVGCVKGRKVTR